MTTDDWRFEGYDGAMGEGRTGDGARVEPVDDAGRVRLIDALRGVALLGILMMNITWFGLPPLFDEGFRRDPTKLDFWVFAIVTVVFEGKMRALFGMLFGAGIVLFATRKTDLGWRAHALFYRRTALLVVMGLFHAHVLLWHGEILYLYGVCGAIAYLFRNVNARWLVLAVPLVGVVDFVAEGHLMAGWRATRIAFVAAEASRGRGETLSPAQEIAVTSYRELESTFLPDHAAAAEITRKMRGGYRDVASHTDAISWKLEGPMLPTSLPDSLALMLLGIGLVRLGFLKGEWRARTYRRIALVGYGLGLPLAAFAHGWWVTHAPNQEAFMRLMETTPVFWVDLIYPFQRMLIVLAHASAGILLFQSGLVPRAFARLAAVGQMALTNYLMQTVLATLFFYGYGLGMYGRLAYHQTFLFIGAVWLVEIAWSKPWLDRFRFGPAEWLWRAGTYLARPVLRRTPATR